MRNCGWLRVWIALIWIVWCTASGAVGPAAAQEGPTNLLVNGDFEQWDWANAGWPYQDNIPEVQVAPGWRAYFLDAPPEGAIAPQFWRRPEFRDTKVVEHDYRVHGGFLAQKYFTFGGQHIAGLYQQVGNITPGTPLRFSAYMETWSCMPADQWNICPTGHLSNSPAPMHTRVGIDPHGGTDPWSPNVVWSPEIDAYDEWTLFQVDAVARANTVTVFTHSYAHWTDTVFRIHNDVYVDDASLIATDGRPAPLPTPTPSPSATPPAPSATPDPSQPTATPEATATPADTATPTPTATPTATSTPVVTATPRSDGAIIHTVQDGETLYAIAIRYMVATARLQQLNDLDDPDVLVAGQELVIVPPPSTPTPFPPTLTPTPSPTATALPTSPTPSSTPPPTEAPATPPAAAAQASTGPDLTLPGIGLSVIAGVTLGFLAARRVRKLPHD